MPTLNLNLAVVECRKVDDPDSPPWLLYAVPVKSETITGATEELGVFEGEGERVVALGEIQFSSGENENELSETYDALVGLNELSDDTPRVQDLLMFFFTEGFKKGKEST